MANPTCPESGHEMHRDVRPRTYDYKGQSATIDVPGWYCDGCGESIHTGRDTKVSSRLLRRMKAKDQGLLIADEVRRIRKRLGLTQKDADSLMGVAPGTFRRCENSDEMVSRAVSGLLRLLDENPDGLSVIRPIECRAPGG